MKTFQVCSPYNGLYWAPNGSRSKWRSKRRWSSLQNMKSTGRSRIQIQLLPPYIYLNLP